MPSRWIEHVKEFAKKNNMSYGCALSDPNLKKGYVPTGDKKRKPEKLEMATPSTEPKPKNIDIIPRPKPAPKTKKSAKELTPKQIANRKALEEEKLATDKLKKKRDDLQKKIEPLEKIWKEWYLNKYQGVIKLKPNELSSHLVRMNLNEIDESSTRNKMRELRTLYEELSAMGDTYLTEKERKAEMKAYKERPKTAQERKADELYRMGN
jgi:hypothetical protein